MKYWILILAAAVLFTAAPGIRAHNLTAINGKTQEHQHVYRRQQYGEPLQQGHRFPSAGTHGAIIWGSDARPEYGKSIVRRNGRIIGDQDPGSALTPKGKGQHGSAVNRYGKPVKGYGKPVHSYGKPERNK